MVEREGDTPRFIGRMGLFPPLLMLVCAIVGGSLLVFPWDPVWDLLGVPKMYPYFADLRTFTHASLSLADGLDPRLTNPHDPWARPLNYPLLWSLAAPFVGPEDTLFIGLGIVVFFLVVMLIIFWSSRPPLAIFALIMMLSMPVLLAMERGNNDLLVIGLVAVACLQQGRSPLVAGLLSYAAFLLKLFPFFALGALLGRGDRRGLGAVITVALCGVLYLAATWTDLSLIREGTPRPIDLAFGLNVLDNAMAKSALVSPWLQKGVLLVLLGLVGAVAIGLALAAGRPPGAADASGPRLAGPQPVALLLGAADLALLRASAGLYAGTYILGANWDYRLVVLLLAIRPLFALRERATCSTFMRLVALVTLVAMTLQLHKDILGILEPELQHLMDASTEFILFGLLCTLGALSLPPQWLRWATKRRPFGKVTGHQQ